MCTSIYHILWMGNRLSNGIRSEVHETLPLLFVWDGVLSACICSSDKKMIQGKSNQKLKGPACHLKQLGPYTA